MAEHCFRVGQGTKLVLVQGDLTAWEGDAIVNAANERMLGGGGVDGAIHRAAGDDLYDACLAVIPTPPNSRCRCPTGEARITPGFDLPAKFVIHTVGPYYENARVSAPLLSAAHRNSLLLAKEKGLKSIAFCAISTGVYGYPIPDAAKIAMQEVKGEAAGLDLIAFVLFSKPILVEYTKAAARLFPEWDASLPSTANTTHEPPSNATAMEASPAPSQTCTANPSSPAAAAAAAAVESEVAETTSVSHATAVSAMDESKAASPADQAPQTEAKPEAASPEPSPDSKPSGSVTGNSNSVVNSNMDRSTVLGMNPTTGAVADATKETTEANLTAVGSAQQGQDHPPSSEPNLLAQSQGIASEIAPAPPTPDAAAAMVDPASVPSPPHTPTPVQPLPTGSGQPTPDAMNVPTKEESELPIPSLLPGKTLPPGEQPKQCNDSTVGERKRLADEMEDA